MYRLRFADLACSGDLRMLVASLVPCCTKDEGRPLGVVMQVKAPNHLKLSASKSSLFMVLGVPTEHELLW